MTAYYNEIDPFAAQWLRNLISAGHIAPGDVDERSIADVQPDDLKGYTQCHFFAGIGGWSYAARLAGWPDDRPIWTGSCPCQPFSRANSVYKRGQGTKDDRHLWPVWGGLIEAMQPAVIFGEQVTDSIAGGWLDEVFGDLERLGYACAATCIAALGVGSPQERERLWIVCDADAERWEGLGLVPAIDGAHAEVTAWSEVARAGGAYRGKRWETKPGVRLLADGIPAHVGRLRAYGNAIVPQVGAQVIAAYLDAEKPAAANDNDGVRDEKAA